MQMIGATKVELGLSEALKFTESQGPSVEATNASVAIGRAIEVLQEIRYANPGGETKWSRSGVFDQNG